MKRIIIYIALLAAALAFPGERTDVGKLKPVGLVQLYKEDDMIVIVTDTGDSGVGKTAQSAFENLEATTSGIIFLDTADYLLLSVSAIDEAEGLEMYLKPSVRVCFAQKDVDPMAAAEYLEVHRPAVQLRDRESLANAETLLQENGRLIMR